MADAGMPDEAAEWAARIQESLDVGHAFAAFDLAREARAAFPDDLHLVLLAALGLMRCGAWPRVAPCWPATRAGSGSARKRPGRSRRLQSGPGRRRWMPATAGRWRRC